MKNGLPPRFERYVAIGDSSTEGIDDPDGEGGPAEAAFAGDAVEGQELGVVHRGWDCTSRLSIRLIVTIVLIDVWS